MKNRFGNLVFGFLDQDRNSKINRIGVPGTPYRKKSAARGAYLEFYHCTSYNKIRYLVMITCVRKTLCNPVFVCRMAKKIKAQKSLHEPAPHLVFS